MTRLWTLPVLVAALTIGACSKQTTEPPPAGDPVAPPQAAPVDATPVPPAAAPAPAPAAPAPTAPARTAPARPAPKTTGESKPLQNTAPTPVVREPPAPPKPTYHDVTVASGTELPIELLTTLSSETAAVETEVRGRLRQAIVVNGETVIPNGATLTGSVTDVASSGKVKGVARLAMRFTSVSYSGESHRISTEPLSFEAESTKKKDAVKVGAGAGIGAAIGGILGGGKGAGIGAAIGGGTGTAAVLATKGKEVELASGAPLAPVLTAPLILTIQN